jgi:DNA-binding transcriptional ArsR family regulator
MKARKKSEIVVSVAAIFSSSLRLQIIEKLREGPMIVGDLVIALGENQATISKQLALLREAGLLACRPDGRCREYALSNVAMTSAAVDALHVLGIDAVARSAECRAKRVARGAS